MVSSTEAPSASVGAPLPLGCAPPPRPRAQHDASAAWIGRSLAAEPRATAAAPAASAAPLTSETSTWELVAQLPGFKIATGRARSQHFTGELEAEVRINAAAEPYPVLGPGRVLPSGAALVEFHYAAGSSEPVALLAMVKRPAGYDPEGGDWEYLLLTPQGRVHHRGALALCKRCHADAPHDHLFGGPR
ncbi:hypothetical protein SOCE26_029390 [Sorangium cellulosum]|uniref:Cytochrome P460 domain-containing protein n=2 Tax=Sorangium cellulosum TaxID=56 RepID=A0A2L0EQE4_SORCE|nr:hypothetical protein SOCE26_029390 [Sorangium cellulosum]